MEQISVRWGDLGSLTEAGTYRCGPHMVEVTPGDMRLAVSQRAGVLLQCHLSRPPMRN
jgi:hypothetical protein